MGGSSGRETLDRKTPTVGGFSLLLVPRANAGV